MASGIFTVNFIDNFISLFGIDCARMASIFASMRSDLSLDCGEPT